MVAPCWSQGVQGSASYLVILSLCEREREKACMWVCCFAFSRGYIFQSEVNRGNNQKHQQSPTFLLPYPLCTILSFMASPPSCLQMHYNSATNFILYFCQSLHFPFTSTHSHVNPPLLHTLYILI